MSIEPFLAAFVVALVLIGAAVCAMAIGVMLRRPCLRGSCGGPRLQGPGGQRISCDGCPNRDRDTAEP